MSLAEAEVEVVKLARLLGTEPGELGFLRQIDWRELRDLREQMTVVMFEADRQILQRVATATRLVPPKITAAIGERAFGALLCARVARLLDPSRAVDIAGHLPAPFLADVAEQLDPRRASRVIAEIPPRQIAQITRELARRGDHVTMGGFVGHLPERALRAALDVVDDATLLRTAFVVESKGSLDALVAIIPESRLAEVLCAATDDHLWGEALDVLRHVSERQRGRLGDIAAGQDDDVLEALVRTAQRDGLWADVLPVTRAMSPAGRARFARLEAVQRRPVLASIMDAAHRERLWPPLMRFAMELELRAQREVARLAVALADDVLAGLLAAVREAGLQDELVTIAGHLGAEELRALSTRAAQLGEDALSEQVGLARQLPGYPRHMGSSSVAEAERDPLEAYGPVGRSEWMDIDWSEHLRWMRVEDRWMNVLEYGSGPPLIFIHGLSGCWQNWLENIPYFARHHRVIAVDLPGFGQSEMPAEEISIKGYAATIDALMVELGIDSAQIVGNSMGGFIGAELAIQHPARVERLVLVAAAGLSIEYIRTERTQGLRHRAENVAFFYIGWLASRSHTVATRRRLRSALLLLVAAHPAKLPPALTIEQVAGSGKPGFSDALDAMCDYPLRDRLEKITCPTFIVWGDKDRLVPVRDAAIFEELIPDSRAVVYTDTGHVVMMERPARFNSDVHAFLDEQPNATLPHSGTRTFAA